MRTEKEDASETNKRMLLELLETARNLKIRSEMGIDCAAEVTKVIQSSDECILKADSAKEAYWEMRVLHTSSLALKNSIHATTASLNYFDPEVFASNLLSFLREDFMSDTRELSWKKLEPIAGASFKYAPSVTYLLGSLPEGPPAEKPQRSRPQRQKMENKTYTNPKGLDQQKKEETDMEERMRHISSIILREYQKNRKPLDFFTFVMDPVSYGRTVQNIFHVSHLVREGLFDLKQADGTSLPAIVPVSKKQRGTNPTRKRRLWHAALTFSVPDWEALKNVLQIEKAMI